MFHRIKGVSGIGLRTYPGTRFSYAGLMVDNVIKNSSNLRELLDDKHKVEWKEATSNKDTTPVVGLDRFMSLVGNLEFSDVIRSVFDVLALMAAALRFIEGDGTRLSFVCPIFTALLAAAAAWDSTLVDNYM